VDKIARNLVPIQIEEEMRSSYLDYSMSVIIGRALPDVRDGLKPVHRRILYAMLREGLLSNRRYSKCAGVVGEVLKKYHPHGDMAVYDALVRMAQPWNLRYLLIDGQGNFGSVDGDPPAAYRYTEARMSRLAEELLADIDAETVNFVPNYDGNTTEPEVLPAAYPNLLVNGAEGIAVGMATKIPPHNLTEVINAVLALIENPGIEIPELMTHVIGPDFPTGATIQGREGIREAYETGRGKVTIRGTAHFEEVEGRDAIIITELPFQVNKATFQETIADLVKDKRVDGIHGVRDESDREGMRVVVELKRDAVPEVVLNQLYKHTQLQTTFGIIMLVIVNQRPRILNLKELLVSYLGHRREVTLRRTRYELRKARDRAHILEGLIKALDHIDAIITLIRSSQTGEEAKSRLISEFQFSEVQAQAILDMRLQRLVGLERQKLEDEYAELVKQIEWLLSILGSETVLLNVIKGELTAIRDKYGDARRTQIVADLGDLSLEDLVASEDQVVTVSHLGYIKRTSLTEYRMQRRGGTGKTGMATRDADFVESIFIANTHSYLLIFTDNGMLYWLRVYDVPEGSPTAKGKPLVNLVKVEPGEKVAAVVSVRDFEEEGVDLVFCSRRGLVKRTALSAYSNIRTVGLTACDVADGDTLLTVKLARIEQPLLLVTRLGMSIRFAGTDIRHLGRVSRGVKGIDLREDDEVVDLEVLPADDSLHLLTATSVGFGKRTRLAEYPTQNRSGLGVRDIDLDVGRPSEVVGAMVVHPGDQLMVITDSGRVIRTAADEVRDVGRRTKGVRLMRLEEGERIVGMARLAEVEAPEGDAGGEPGGEAGAEGADEAEADGGTPDTDAT
jgi:DNA gyrase subunit A